jgi:hypothetical protein
MLGPEKVDKKYLVPATSLAPTTTQGWLTKIGEKVKNWKRRWFILKDDVLFYYKKPNVRCLTRVWYRFCLFVPFAVRLRSRRVSSY